MEVSSFTVSKLLLLFDDFLQAWHSCWFYLLVGIRCGNFMLGFKIFKVKFSDFWQQNSPSHCLIHRFNSSFFMLLACAVLLRTTGRLFGLAQFQRTLSMPTSFLNKCWLFTIFVCWMIVAIICEGVRVFFLIAILSGRYHNPNFLLLLAINSGKRVIGILANRVRKGSNHFSWCFGQVRCGLVCFLVHVSIIIVMN